MPVSKPDLNQRNRYEKSEDYIKFSSELAANLHGLRVSNLCSLKDFAQITGLTKESVAKYENVKKPHNVPAYAIRRICEAYMISADKLLGTDKNLPPSSQEILQDLSFLDSEDLEVVKTMIRHLKKKHLDLPSQP